MNQIARAQHERRRRWRVRAAGRGGVPIDIAAAVARIVNDVGPAANDADSSVLTL